VLKLLHAADLHFGLTTYGREEAGGNSRWNDFEATFNRFIDEAIARTDVRVVVLSGDTTNTRTPPPGVILILVRGIRRLMDAEIIVLIGSGNHDGPGTMFDTQSKTTGWLAELRLPGVRAYPAPTVDLVHTNVGDLAVVAIPYAHKRSLEKQYPDKGLLELTELASREVENLIEDLADTARTRYPSVPLLFVGHLTVAGGLAGSESAMQMGWDVMVGKHVFEPFTYAALGHLHPQQRLADNVWYSGSPEYMSFNEEGQPKGWLEVELDPLTVTPMPSNARPMYTLDVYPDRIDGDVEAVADAIVRFRLNGLTVADALRIPAVKELRDGASWSRFETLRQAETPVRFAASVDGMQAQDMGIVQATRFWFEQQGLAPEKIDRLMARAVALLDEGNTQSGPLVDTGVHPEMTLDLRADDSGLEPLRLFAADRDNGME
jgi:exonuclease SbcD